jgi:hypothetical protein
MKDGSLYKARSSLVDNQGYASASDGMVKFVITDSDNGIERYRQEFPVSSNEVQQYKLLISGQPIHAYAWQFSDFTGNGSNTATITLTLPNDKVFTTEDSLYS